MLKKHLQCGIHAKHARRAAMVRDRIVWSLLACGNRRKAQRDTLERAAAVAACKLEPICGCVPLVVNDLIRRYAG